MRRTRMVLRFHHTCFTLTIVSLLRVCSRTLCAQWTCHVLRTHLSCIPISRIMCHRLVYLYVPISVSRVSLLLPNVDCRLVAGYLFVSLFSFCLVNSSTYVSRLCLSPFVLSTRLYAYLYCLRLPALVRRLVSCLIILRL